MDRNFTVVGVVENFKTAGFSSDLPISFFLGKQEEYGYMAIRHAAGTGEQVATSVHNSWTKLYPTIPFNFSTKI